MIIGVKFPDDDENNKKKKVSKSIEKVNYDDLEKFLQSNYKKWKNKI